MSRPESSPSGPTNSAALAFSTLESLLLILIGVSASKLDSWFLIGSLLLIVACIFLIRWILAEPVDKALALARLDERYQDRATLWHDLRAIIVIHINLLRKPEEQENFLVVATDVERGVSHPWSPLQFRDATLMWFLKSSHDRHMGITEKILPTIPEADEADEIWQQYLRRPRLQRVRDRLTFIRHRPRQLVSQQPTDYRALSLVGWDKVSRLILRRSIEEEFVTEVFSTTKANILPDILYQLVESPPLRPSATEPRDS